MNKHIEKLWLVFSRPKDFFAHIEDEDSYVPGLFLYVIATSIIYFITMLLGIPKQLGISPLGIVLVSLLIGFIFMVGFLFAMPFIASGIIHLGVLIFGGKKGFLQTYKVVTYTLTIGIWYMLVISIIQLLLLPYFPVSVDANNPLMSLMSYYTSIPFLISLIIGIGAYIHQLIAQVIGLKMYHAMSTARAFWSAFLIPLILTLLLIGFVILIMLIAVGSSVAQI